MAGSAAQICGEPPVEPEASDKVRSFPPRIGQAIAGKHVLVLDGIRGFAVSYVILYHFIPSTLSLTFRNRLLEMWDTFWLMGWSGVDLFFVLSGFLITGILYKSKGKPNFFRNFYVRRFLRIFPIYYLLLFACLVVTPLVTGKAALPHSYYYPLYLSNFDTELAIPIHPVLVVTWSLAIEEQYYIFYPTIVHLVNLKNLIRVLIGFVAVSITLRFLGHYLGFFQPRQQYHFTLAHFDGIALGGLLRLLVNNYQSYANLLTKFLKFLPVVLVVSWGLNLYCGDQVLRDLRPGHNPDHISFLPSMYLLGYTLNALSYAGILLLCLSKDGLIYKAFNWGPLREIGKVSYGMYLLQYPSRMIFQKLTEPWHVTNGFVTAIGVFTICYVMAKISWTIYESPILNLKDRFTREDILSPATA